MNKIKRYQFGSAMPKTIGHLKWMSTLTKHDQDAVYYDKSIGKEDPFKKVLDFKYHPKSLIEKMSYIDIKTYLPDNNLYKTDSMSMLNSLEVRVPILDNDMIDFAASVPPNLKLNGITTKYLLKKSMSKFLPKDILYRKKQGFSIPMKLWINNELKYIVDESLSENNLNDKGFFSYDYAKKIVDEHKTNKKDNWHRIWSIVCFNSWHDRYIDGFEAEK
ncbi:MAG: asparagine synthase C-terminal domain-containing protein [archaeon]